MAETDHPVPTAANRRNTLSRRACIAGLAATPALPAAASVNPLSLEASDPWLSKWWRELYAQLTSVIAEINNDRDDEQEEAFQERWDTVHDNLGHFQTQLWSARPRTFGDLVLRAAVARYWMDEKTGGHWELRGSADDLALDHLLLAVIDLAGLPDVPRWQAVLAPLARG